MGDPTAWPTRSGADWFDGSMALTLWSHRRAAGQHSGNSDASDLAHEKQVEAALALPPDVRSYGPLPIS